VGEWWVGQGGEAGGELKGGRSGGEEMVVSFQLSFLAHYLADAGIRGISFQKLGESGALPRFHFGEIELYITYSGGAWKRHVVFFASRRKKKIRRGGVMGLTCSKGLAGC